MRAELLSQLIKSIGVKHKNDLGGIAIKVCDLNLRMRQFNLRMSAKIIWRSGGLPKWYLDINDILHKPLFKTHGYDLNYLLHEGIVFY